MTTPIELRALLRGTRRLWWLVSVFVLLGGVGGYLLSTQMTKVYEATTTVLVGDTLRSTNLEIDDVKASQSVTLTYSDIVRRQPVLQGVIGTLHLPTSWLELRDRVRVELASNNAQLIVVTVEGRSRAEAEAIAHEIGNQLLALGPSRGISEKQKFVLDQLADLQKRIVDGQARAAELQGDLIKADSQDADLLRWRIDNLESTLSAWQDNYASLSALMPNRGAATSLEVLEDAYSLPYPVRPRPRINAMLGAAIGGMLAIAIVYVAELRHRAARSPVRGWARLRRRRAISDEPRLGEPDETVPQVEVVVPETVP